MDIEYLRGWRGRTQRIADIVSPRLVDQYSATLKPIFAGIDSAHAPLGIHWCLAADTPPMADLGADGHAAKGVFLPSVPLPRRMWASGSVEFHASLQLNDRVERVPTIKDVTLKAGRSGPLCFVDVEHAYSTVRGIAVREQQVLVYRETAVAGSVPPNPADKPPQSPPLGEIAWQLDASSALLFRYSAMTFNSHRIHYDFPYATGIEGYQGIVVHGPLQATLLLNAAARLAKRSPRTFRFRGLAPLTLGEGWWVCADRDGEAGAICRSESDAGIVKMEATATW